VHLQSAVIDAGQRLPGEAGQGLPPDQRISGPDRKVAGQLAGGAGEHLGGNRLGGQERAQPGQRGGGRILAAEPVRDQICGGRQ
jgi:hypothetical protein